MIDFAEAQGHEFSDGIRDLAAQPARSGAGGEKSEDAAVTCCTCGVPIRAKEILRLEGMPCCQRCLAGFAGAVRQAAERPTLSASLIPWLRRDELGITRAFVQTVTDGLSHPTRFFSGLPMASAPWAPLLFAVVCTVVFYFPGELMNQRLVLPVILAQLEFSQESGQVTGLFGSLLQMLGPLAERMVVQLEEGGIDYWLLIMSDFLVFGVLLASWIQQVFIYLAGSRRGFDATLQVRCYSLVGMTFHLIPIVGWFIGPIYWIAINALGLREVHGISVWASILAAVMPLLLFRLLALSAALTVA